jgi:hypothetical protein
MGSCEHESERVGSIKRQGIYPLADELLPSREEGCSMELVHEISQLYHQLSVPSVYLHKSHAYLINNL